jgi:hypothetical protein
MWDEISRVSAGGIVGNAIAIIALRGAQLVLVNKIHINAMNACRIVGGIKATESIPDRQKS